MKKSLSLAATLFLLTAFVFPQATTTTSSYKWEWVNFYWPPEMFPCLGEGVFLNGIVHVLLHQTTDAAGTIHIKMHYQPQNLRAVGETSGTNWVASGAGDWTYKFGGVNYPLYIETFIDNAVLASPGSAINLKYRVRLRVTINTNGIETVYIDVETIECK